MVDATPISDGKRRGVSVPSAADFWQLAQTVANAGTRGASRLTFLEEVSTQMLVFADCDAVSWWVADTRPFVFGRVDRANAAPGEGDGPISSGPAHNPLDEPSGAVSARPVRLQVRPLKSEGSSGDNRGDLITRFQGIFEAVRGESPTNEARSGAAVLDDAARRRLRPILTGESGFSALLEPIGTAPAIVLLLRANGETVGLAMLSGANRDTDNESLVLYGQLSESICRALVNRRAQFRLRERIKELTCLHGVARLTQRYDGDPTRLLQAMVELLPPAMQFPESAVARMEIDGGLYVSQWGGPGGEPTWQIETPIVIAGKPRGRLTVGYVDAHPEFVLGPFLSEEEDLLRSVAHEAAAVVARGEAEAGKAAMAEQLRHQDRLATIGQLAAGVAHELNEPLGNILGFAELMLKQPDLPPAAANDARQVVSAALHGRQIVRQLLLFARQSASERIELDLSALVRDSLYFLEARCRRAGIQIELNLCDEPAPILGDRSQITQVIVNLAVNAVQAMPKGGTLTVATRVENDVVVFAVSDTGEGMDEHTRERLFTPFFTTKDIGEGTGLGLSVVLGIVSAHHGTIHVDSAPGRGAVFEVRLPRGDSTGTMPTEAP